MSQVELSKFHVEDWAALHGVKTLTFLIFLVLRNYKNGNLPSF